MLILTYTSVHSTVENIYAYKFIYTVYIIYKALSRMSSSLNAQFTASVAYDNKERKYEFILWSNECRYTQK